MRVSGRQRGDGHNCQLASSSVELLLQHDCIYAVENILGPLQNVHLQALKKNVLNNLLSSLSSAPCRVKL